MTSQSSGCQTNIKSLILPEPANCEYHVKNTAESDEKLECPICLDSSLDEKLYHLKHCKHAFHMSCLREWLQFQTTCPMCRALLQVPVSLRYRGHYQVENKSHNCKLMHAILRRLVERISCAGLFSKYSKVVRGEINCDKENIIFSTREPISKNCQPLRTMSLFQRKHSSSTESTINISVQDLREIYFRGKHCLLAVAEPCNQIKYTVYAFDAGDIPCAARVFSKLREICSQHSYIRGVRFE